MLTDLTTSIYSKRIKLYIQQLLRISIHGCVVRARARVNILRQSHAIITIQVNEKFFELKKGHIGIVEKAQETRSDSDMHI